MKVCLRMVWYERVSNSFSLTLSRWMVWYEVLPILPRSPHSVSIIGEFAKLQLLQGVCSSRSSRGTDIVNATANPWEKDLPGEVDWI